MRNPTAEGSGNAETGGTCKVPAVPMGKLYHLSRLAAPKTWPIERKGNKWIARPIAGPHSIELAMPLVVWLRETLGLATTAKAIKKVLAAGEIKVNNKIVKEPNHPVGLFDVISIDTVSKHYRILVDQNGRLRIAEIPRAESKVIPLKVIKKSIIKNGKTQFGFNNGWSLLLNEKVVAGDCILYDFETKRIKTVMKQEPGTLAYIISGEHANQIAKLDAIVSQGQLRKKKLAVLSRDSEKFQTAAEKIFIIGKTKEEISLK